MTLSTRPIDARKRTEEALRERDEQLSVALQAANAGVSSLDLETGIGITTPQWRDVLGFAPPPALQTFDALLASVHPDDRERVARLHADPAQVQKGLDFEFRLQHPTKGERWILSRSRHLAVPGAARSSSGSAQPATSPSANAARRKTPSSQK